MNSQQHLRVAHVNIARSHTSFLSVYRNAVESDWDVVCLQEPHIYPILDGYEYRVWKGYKGIHHKKVSIFFSEKLTGIVILAEELLAIVKIGDLYIINAYFHDAICPSVLIDKIPHEALLEGKWILVGDSNSSSPLWDFNSEQGYTPNTQKRNRGKIFEDWLEKVRGNCLNNYTEYGSYVGPLGDSYIDITLVGSNCPAFQWDLLEEISATDHRTIVFRIENRTIKKKVRYITDWKEYRKYQQDRKFDLFQRGEGKFWPAYFYDEVMEAKKTAAQKIKSKITPHYWWNTELDKLLTELNKAQNKWRKNRTSRTLTDRRDELRKEFKYKVRKIKREAKKGLLAKADWGPEGRKEFKTILNMVKGTKRAQVQGKLVDDEGKTIPTEDIPKTLLQLAFIHEEGKPDLNMDTTIANKLRRSVRSCNIPSRNSKSRKRYRASKPSQRLAMMGSV